MPRRHRHRRRTMKGGFLDNLSNALSGWGSSITQGASNIWEKTKNATSNLTGSTTSAPATTSYTPSTYQTSMATSTYGGKHSRRRRRMKGGYEANTSTTGLAVRAAPISGVPTAEPQTIVGGKTRRRGRKGRKTRRH